ncbi:TonB-dependent receptor plug domain-containing protein [Salmonella enterica subsp. enterica serovar Typhimurium]|nr:hypothetical protein [Salmonella enterica subsp. enterica serovar Typhimurium]ECV9223349.1 TonB-dependent receptor plug domain-containing protein [Salmonella enterica subsp. enterica serovar Typhimurium]
MFRFNPFVRVGLCMSAVTLAWPVAAATDDGETMVVTASAIEQNLKDAPASISVITQQDLQRRPVQNLKDVLKEVPGVQLTNEGDNRKGVSIRGLDSSYTLILIDGKRVNSRNAVFRHNDFDLNWIPVDAIERIEVVRGPMSSLYGSDALGGQVQIPCIERNAISAVKAINAATMAMSRVSEPCISLDEIIAAMYETGKDMSAKYRETYHGSLGKIQPRKRG